MAYALGALGPCLKAYSLIPYMVYDIPYIIYMVYHIPYIIYMVYDIPYIIYMVYHIPMNLGIYHDI